MRSRGRVYLRFHPLLGSASGQGGKWTRPVFEVGLPPVGNQMQRQGRR